MFISNAFAQTADAASPAAGTMSFFWIFGIMFVMMYFLTIRPQMKKQKEMKAMVDALAKGDEVVTAGGVVGKITKVSSDNAYLTLEIAEGTEIIVQKSAVQMLLPKGTMKSL